MKKKHELQIAPSILSADFGRLKDEIAAVEKAGADIIHLDIMDGHFVPNLTFGPYGVSCIRKYTRKPLDVHLMVDDPDMFIKPFADAGADMLSVHIEAAAHIQRTLEEIKKLGAKAGIAINPATPAENLEYIVEYADFVLVMTVNPGFGGQKYLSPMTHKIRQTRKIINERNPECIIEVDGGIDIETAPRVYDAGARMLVAGNAIFRAGDYKKAISDIRKACK